MGKVKIIPLEKRKELHDPMISMGNIVIIDTAFQGPTPYIVACIDFGKFTLISLTDGNRWTEPVEISTEYFKLSQVLQNTESNPRIIGVIRNPEITVDGDLEEIGVSWKEFAKWFLNDPEEPCNDDLDLDWEDDEDDEDDWDSEV